MNFKLTNNCEGRSRYVLCTYENSLLETFTKSLKRKNNMEPFLTYLLKSTALLSIFYLVYLLLLKNETSFTENRKFLLGGIIASAVLPAVYFTRKVFVEATNFSVNDIPISTNASSEVLSSNLGVW